MLQMSRQQATSLNAGSEGCKMDLLGWQVPSVCLALFMHQSQTADKHDWPGSCLRTLFSAGWFVCSWLGFARCAHARAHTVVCRMACAYGWDLGVQMAEQHL